MRNISRKGLALSPQRRLQPLEETKNPNAKLIDSKRTFLYKISTKNGLSSSPIIRKNDHAKT